MRCVRGSLTTFDGHRFCFQSTVKDRLCWGIGDVITAETAFFLASILPQRSRNYADLYFAARGRRPGNLSRLILSRALLRASFFFTYVLPPINSATRVARREYRSAQEKALLLTKSRASAFRYPASNLVGRALGSRPFLRSSPSFVYFPSSTGKKPPAA